VPDFCRKKSSAVISIKSFTQGTYGSVVLNHYGTLTYKSEFNTEKPDQFTVTLESAEGDVSTKTIFITKWTRYDKGA